MHLMQLSPAAVVFNSSLTAMSEVLFAENPILNFRGPNPGVSV